MVERLNKQLKSNNFLASCGGHPITAGERNIIQVND
jgi:hypothetical protein